MTSPHTSACTHIPTLHTCWCTNTRVSLYFHPHAQTRAHRCTGAHACTRCAHCFVQSCMRARLLPKPARVWLPVLMQEQCLTAAWWSQRCWQPVRDGGRLLVQSHTHWSPSSWGLHNCGLLLRWQRQGWAGRQGERHSCPRPSGRACGSRSWLSSVIKPIKRKTAVRRMNSLSQGNRRLVNRWASWSGKGNETANLESAARPPVLAGLSAWVGGMCGTHFGS